MVVSSEGYRSWLPWHSSLVPTFVPDDVTSPAYTAAAPLGLMLSSADGIWLVQAGEVFLLGASLSVPHGVYLQNCWAVVAEGSVPLCTNLLVRSSAPFLFFLPFRCCGWGPPYSWGCSCKTLKKKIYSSSCVFASSSFKGKSFSDWGDKSLPDKCHLSFPSMSQPVPFCLLPITLVVVLSHFLPSPVSVNYFLHPHSCLHLVVPYPLCSVLLSMSSCPWRRQEGCAGLGSPTWGPQDLVERFLLLESCRWACVHVASVASSISPWPSFPVSVLIVKFSWT